MKDFEKKLTKILNEGRSGDLDGFGCAEYNPELVPKILSLFSSNYEELGKELIGPDEVRRDEAGIYWYGGTGIRENNPDLVDPSRAEAIKRDKMRSLLRDRLSKQLQELGVK